jgi:hypothetical protein
VSDVLFDHIAIGIHRMADAPAVLVGALGGIPVSPTGRTASCTASSRATAPASTT